MTSIYHAILDFIREKKEEKNVLLTKKEYRLYDAKRYGKMTLKWWKENSILIISDIKLETPLVSSSRNLLTRTVRKVLSRDEENNHPELFIIQSVMLEGVYDQELVKKLNEKDWTTDGMSNMRFY